jgi:lysophospholipase L1-like esterase
MIRRPLVALVAFACCWGIPELLVRIADPPLGSYLDIQFGRDPRSTLLFVRDPHLHWRLRPDVEVAFKGRRVRTGPHGFQNEPAVAAGRTLLVLGDSTPFGWGVADGEGFADLLRSDPGGGAEPALREAGWRVLNAAVPGYSSFQVRLQAEALIPSWRPEWVVVCVGSNDAWPAERSDRELDASRRVAAALESALSKSRFLVWASERLRPPRPRPFVATALAHSVPRVSLAEYAENLRTVVKLAHAHGARVTLLAPPANPYHAPERRELLPQLAGWQELEGRVRELVRDGAGSQALAEARAAAATAPESFYPLYLEGIVLSLMGRSEAGLEALEQALERHPYPERCKRSYREAARRVAEEEGAGFVDVNALFRAAHPDDPHRAAGYYLDWCHPTPEGHRLIADALRGKSPAPR